MTRELVTPQDAEAWFAIAPAAKAKRNGRKVLAALTLRTKLGSIE
jgi:hypothetical protein